MKTGLTLIDDVLINGLEKNKVNILEGKMAVGKTITMLKLAKNIFDSNKNVLFITQEEYIKSLQRKLAKIICESEDIDKEKIKTYINNLSSLFRILKVKHELTNLDLIDKLNDSDDFDLIILDDIVIDGGIDYNLINNSVKPIVFFTKSLSRVISKVNVPFNFDTLDNFEVIRLDVKKYENGDKICDLFHNNSLIGEITLTGII
jgi:predicted ATP-dependent serine protease